MKTETLDTSLKKSITQFDLLNQKTEDKNIRNTVINADCFEWLSTCESNIFDLIIIDPPYNLSKKFNALNFKKIKNEQYYNYLIPVIKECCRILKNTGSIYVCCDWTSSSIVHFALSDYFQVRNRITWKRDKGRSSKTNWKNNLEDIYFATKTNDYYFNPVKIKKKVIAPYRDKNKNNKDWYTEKGKNYRHTACGNFMDNITIPFWSMKENTPHPTQKPEKLMAKLILASSQKDDLVLDLFSGSGTTSVVSKKLQRQYVAVEKDKEYCNIIHNRLTNSVNVIQGYENGVFLEKNYNV